MGCNAGDYLARLHSSIVMSESHDWSDKNFRYLYRGIQIYFIVFLEHISRMASEQVGVRIPRSWLLCSLLCNDIERKIPCQSI